ncbi:LamG-like jellyroll fold domain-containing protein [Prosthecobacter sp.]|uniref:LamG-like jellyroll fold domain-containing protein n=1 Tax=Prosthecobacter sp. TaxID=1965333 RepID=UPI003783A064
MSEELHEIIAAWFGEEMPEARRAELLKRLREDGELRKELATELRTFGSLQAVQAPEPRWLELQDELGLAAAKNDFSDERLREALRKQPRPFVASWWRPVAALAACLAAVFAVLLLMKPNQSTVAAAGRENLALVVKADEVKWNAAQADVPKVGDLVGVGNLRFDSGRLTLAFLSGVSVHIEGPADLTLQDSERITCRRGNVRTHVNKGAEGFTIETPGGAVVDLGTEFGVNVEGEGKTQVMVYQGQAELAMLSKDGSPLRTRLLSAQQSSELDPRTNTLRGIDPREMLTAPDLRIPPLVLSADYSQRILKSKPLHYWHGPAAQGGHIEDAAPGGAKALNIHGPIAPQSDGSLAFSADSEPQFLQADGEWTPPDEFAVELWFASDAFHSSALAVLHALDDENDTLSLLQLTRRDARNALRPGRVRFLFRWPPGSRDGMNVYSAPLYTPYRWQHLVCQRRGDKLEMYLDGRLVGDAALPGAEKTTACALSFGRLFKAAGHREGRQFVGRMAQMAVYEHVLSAQEIREHAAR